jgi:hypothetical protein
MTRVLRLALAVVAVAFGAFVFGGVSDASAHGSRTSFFVGVGVPCCYYRPYYRPYYYYPDYYYAPPPVVYAPPPVVYSAPPVVVTQPAPMAATGTSPSYTAPNGQTCREFQSTAVIGGQSQPIYGTACLQSDGSWRVVR